MRNDYTISCMKSQSGFPSRFILHVSACDSMLLRDVLHAGSQKVLVILLNAAAVSSRQRSGIIPCICMSFMT